jgi:hypothetical protein
MVSRGPGGLSRNRSQLDRGVCEPYQICELDSKTLFTDMVKQRVGILTLYYSCNLNDKQEGKSAEQRSEMTQIKIGALN